MNRILAVAVAVAVAVVAARPPAAVAEGLKIGVVNMARVMEAFPDTQAADETLERQKAEYEQERKLLLEDYRRLREEADAAAKDAANRAWSAEERTKKETAAEVKAAEAEDQRRKLRETDEFKQKQLTDQMVRMRRRILTRLQEIVGGYAKEQGYTLVLDAGEGLATLPPVIYHDDALDITEAVLKLIAAPAPTGGPTNGVPRAP